MKTWAFEQPALNGCSLMSTVIVEDQMNVKLCRHLRIDLVEELAKLNRAMAPVELANHLASLSVQGGEQRSGAVALVVMSPAFRLSRAHRQNWLRAIQSLNLRFLVNTQHQRLIRGSHVKPDDVPHFVDEQGILGKFEALAAVRRQSESSPHPMDTTTTQSTSRSQRARAPVRSILRRGLQGHRQHSFHFSITHSARRSRARLVQQTINPLFQKPRPPLANHLFSDAQASRHLGITFSGGALQNNARSLGQRLARFRSPGPTLQRLSFFRRNTQLCKLSSSSHRTSLV